MKVINCECGYIVRGESDEEVVDKISDSDTRLLWARV